MKARWVGVLMAGAWILVGATVARADERAGAGAGERRELSGTVVRSQANTLYVEHMGAVVPIEISQGTRFSGVRSADQLGEGQAVVASFTVREETKNIAHSISLSGAPSATKARRGVGDDPYNRSQDFGG